MIINGVELECDVLEASTIRLVEKELQKVKTIDEKINETESEADKVEKICNIMFDFFDNIFGEGTAKKIFGDKVNLGLCMDAFAEFIDQKTEQEKAFKAKADKYKPNRQSRRSK